MVSSPLAKPARELAGAAWNRLAGKQGVGHQAADWVQQGVTEHVIPGLQRMHDEDNARGEILKLANKGLKLYEQFEQIEAPKSLIKIEGSEEGLSLDKIDREAMQFGAQFAKGLNIDPRIGIVAGLMLNPIDPLGVIGDVKKLGKVLKMNPKQAMAIAGGMGFDLDINDINKFSESGARVYNADANKLKKPVTKTQNVVTVPDEFNALKNITPQEVNKRIEAFKKIHEKARKMKPSDAKTSALSTVGGKREYKWDRKKKLEEGVPLDSPGIEGSVTKTGHHDFQKELSKTFIEKAFELVENGKATYADIINLEELAKQKGLAGLGDSGIQWLYEVPHNKAHNQLLQEGIQPTPGIPPLTSDMSAAALKSEAKKIKDPGEVITYPGPSLGVLQENILKIDNIQDLVTEFTGTIDDIMLPMQQRMLELDDAYEAVPNRGELQQAYIDRDKLKDIRRPLKKAGQKTPELDAQIVQSQEKASKIKRKKEKDLMEIVEGRRITASNKRSLALDELQKQAEAMMEAKNKEDLWNGKGR